ncbi:unnamed protein product [Amoebophrya sp. A120]|nr:unnamed protein product [Amoebophrya sp. A120]|eukprot:GSA120T00007817001.1
MGAACSTANFKALAFSSFFVVVWQLSLSSIFVQIRKIASLPVEWTQPYMFTEWSHLPHRNYYNSNYAAAVVYSDGKEEKGQNLHQMSTSGTSGSGGTSTRIDGKVKEQSQSSKTSSVENKWQQRLRGRWVRPSLLDVFLFHDPESYNRPYLMRLQEGHTMHSWRDLKTQEDQEKEEKAALIAAAGAGTTKMKSSPAAHNNDAMTTESQSESHSLMSRPPPSNPNESAIAFLFLLMREVDTAKMWDFFFDKKFSQMFTIYVHQAAEKSGSVLGWEQVWEENSNEPVLKLPPVGMRRVENRPRPVVNSTSKGGPHLQRSSSRTSARLFAKHVSYTVIERQYSNWCALLAAQVGLFHRALFETKNKFFVLLSQNHSPLVPFPQFFQNLFFSTSSSAGAAFTSTSAGVALSSTHSPMNKNKPSAHDEKDHQSRFCFAGTASYDTPSGCSYAAWAPWGGRYLLKHHQWIILNRRHTEQLATSAFTRELFKSYRRLYTFAPLCSDEVVPALALLTKVPKFATSEQTFAANNIKQECTTFAYWKGCLYQETRVLKDFVIGEEVVVTDDSSSADGRGPGGHQHQTVLVESLLDEREQATEKQMLRDQQNIKEVGKVVKTQLKQGQKLLTAYRSESSKIATQIDSKLKEFDSAADKVLMKGIEKVSEGGKKLLDAATRRRVGESSEIMGDDDKGMHQIMLSRNLADTENKEPVPSAPSTTSFPAAAPSVVTTSSVSTTLSPAPPATTQLINSNGKVGLKTRKIHVNDGMVHFDEKKNILYCNISHPFFELLQQKDFHLDPRWIHLVEEDSTSSSQLFDRAGGNNSMTAGAKPGNSTTVTSPFFSDFTTGFSSWNETLAYYSTWWLNTFKNISLFNALALTNTTTAINTTSSRSSASSTVQHPKQHPFELMSDYGTHIHSLFTNSLKKPSLLLSSGASDAMKTDDAMKKDTHPGTLLIKNRGAFAERLVRSGYLLARKMGPFPLISFWTREEQESVNFENFYDKVQLKQSGGKNGVQQNREVKTNTKRLSTAKIRRRKLLRRRAVSRTRISGSNVDEQMKSTSENENALLARTAASPAKNHGKRILAASPPSTPDEAEYFLPRLPKVPPWMNRRIAIVFGYPRVDDLFEDGNFIYHTSKLWLLVWDWIEPFYATCLLWSFTGFLFYKVVIKQKYWRLLFLSLVLFYGELCRVLHSLLKLEGRDWFLTRLEMDDL